MSIAKVKSSCRGLSGNGLRSKGGRRRDAERNAEPRIEEREREKERERKRREQEREREEEDGSCHCRSCTVVVHAMVQIISLMALCSSWAAGAADVDAACARRLTDVDEDLLVQTKLSSIGTNIVLAPSGSRHGIAAGLRCPKWTTCLRYSATFPLTSNGYPVIDFVMRFYMGEALDAAMETLSCPYSPLMATELHDDEPESAAEGTFKGAKNNGADQYAVYYAGYPLANLTRPGFAGLNATLLGLWPNAAYVSLVVYYGLTRANKSALTFVQYEAASFDAFGSGVHCWASASNPFVRGSPTVQTYLRQTSCADRNCTMGATSLSEWKSMNETNDIQRFSASSSQPRRRLLTSSSGLRRAARNCRTAGQLPGVLLRLIGGLGLKVWGLFFFA